MNSQRDTNNIQLKIPLKSLQKFRDPEKKNQYKFSYRAENEVVSVIFFCRSQQPIKTVANSDAGNLYYIFEHTCDHQVVIEKLTAYLVKEMRAREVDPGDTSDIKIMNC